MKRKSIFAINKDDRIMNEIMKIDTIQQYNDYFGVETLHPLVSVIEGSRGKPLYYCRKLYNVYAILLKDTDSSNTGKAPTTTSGERFFSLHPVR